jgi:hypothetical protein
LVRDVQNTSQSFIREMERAADDHSYGPDISRAHLIEDPLATTAPTAPSYEPAEPYVHPYAAAEPVAAPAAVPASPHHDVMPPRAAGTTGDHDLPP